MTTEVNIISVWLERKLGGFKNQQEILKIICDVINGHILTLETPVRMLQLCLGRRFLSGIALPAPSHCEALLFDKILDWL